MNKYATGPLLVQARRCLLLVKLLYFTDLPLPKINNRWPWCRKRSRELEWQRTFADSFVESRLVGRLIPAFAGRGGPQFCSLAHICSLWRCALRTAPNKDRERAAERCPNEETVRCPYLGLAPSARQWDRTMTGKKKLRKYYLKTVCRFFFQTVQTLQNLCVIYEAAVSAWPLE
jgi:hypothetical protein